MRNAFNFQDPIFKSRQKRALVSNLRAHFCDSLFIGPCHQSEPDLFAVSQNSLKTIPVFEVVFIIIIQHLDRKIV